MATWPQNYDPLGNAALSTIVAAIMGVLVYLQAYIPPFTEMVVK